MNRDNIENIEKIVREVSPAYIDPNANILTSQLFDDLGFDSVGFITLLVRVEKEFDIEIQSEYLLPEYFDSIEKIDEFITKVVS